MKNQANLGDKNNQQTEQNPANQPAQNTVEPKINYWIILTVVLLVSLFIAPLTWFFAYKPKEESSPPEQRTTKTANETPEASENLNQENLPLDVSEVWTLERDWLESGYAPQQLEQGGGLKLERDWLTVFIPPGATPANSKLTFMLVPEPTYDPVVIAF